MPLSFRKEIYLGGSAIGFYYESASGLIAGKGLYPSFGKFMFLADMVSIYNDYFRETHRRSNTECGIGASVFGTNEDIDLTSIEFVYTVPNGHQRRHYDISYTWLAAAQAAIDGVGLGGFPKFFDGPGGLYDFVKNLIGGIPYIGPLTIYDTAIRIGQKLSPKVEPIDFVYIPAGGPLDGAKKYLSTYAGMPVPPIIPNPERIAVRLFGLLSAFGLSPFEIEDLLCVFHNHI